MNMARITPTTSEERNMMKRMRWNGRGGYADGLTEGDRMVKLKIDVKKETKSPVLSAPT
jgi:hypothetical protein